MTGILGVLTRVSGTLTDLEEALTSAQSERVLAIEAALAAEVASLTSAVNAYREAQTDAAPRLTTGETERLQHAVLQIGLATDRCEALGRSAGTLLQALQIGGDAYGADGTRRGARPALTSIESRS